MKFNFRLEKILHFVRIKESAKRMELATVQQRIGFLKRRRTELELNIQQLLHMHAGVKCDWVVYQTNKITLDTREVERFGKLIAEEQILLDKKKSELSRLLMRKKALETLREKQWSEHRVREARREQTRIDEAFRLAKGK